MTDRDDRDPRLPPVDPYLPQLRTALVLTGTGTDGAYHAGVLRAFQEAGVKLDIVGARGIGVVGALFAAIDGSQRLWDDKGFWRGPGLHSMYGWRAVPKLVAGAVAVAAAIVMLPIVGVALGLVVFPIDFLAKIVGASGAGGLVDGYLRLAHAAFAPEALPTWLPRLVLLVMAVAVVTALVTTWGPLTRQRRGMVWWRAMQPPLSTSRIVDRCWRTLWELIRGAAHVKQPPAPELARRYTDLLAENLGQPGFRELLFIVHDVDAHRDLVFPLVMEERRRALVRRSSTAAADARRAEVFDLAGVARSHLVDAVSAALSLPLATDWHPVTFAADGYWRGETHRLADRPASLIRLVDELIELGVEQIILVSAAPEAPRPHALAATRLEVHGRLGEYLRSAEAASVCDATNTTEGVRIFTVRPAHNPIGPFDFDGGYDDQSQREQKLTELINRGYEDAYHQFIEPVLGASGDRIVARARQA